MGLTFNKQTIISDHEFDNYLRLFGRLLQLTSSQQESIADELRDHLELRVAELVEQGIQHDEAVALALDDFGDAAAMAKNFQLVSQLKRRRWMMRFATLSIAGLFFAVVFTMAMWPEKTRFGSPDKIHAQADETPAPVEKIPVAPANSAAVEIKLKELANLNYEEAPWRDIEEELERQYRFNIQIDQTAEDDINEDELVTVNLTGVALEQALHLMLEVKNCTFFVDGGVIRIISIDSAVDPRLMQMKMYDCRELISKLDVHATDQKVQPKEALLLSLLRSMIESDTWAEPGPGSGTARVVNGILMVSQTRRVHQKVETFLSELGSQLKTKQLQVSTPTN